MKGNFKNKALTFALIFTFLLTTSISVFAVDPLPTGSFHGTIMDSETMEPVDSVSLLLKDSTGTVVDSATTNADGTFSFLSKATGAYYVVVDSDAYVATDQTEYEQNSIKGFQIAIINGKDSTFVKGGEIRYVTHIVGDVTITKTDADTNAPLAGVSYKLYDSENNFIDEYATNSSGKIIVENLSGGTYYFVESAALPGYILDEGHKNFTINSTNNNVSLPLTNASSEKPMITINKYAKDSTDRVIGAKLAIYKGSEKITENVMDNDCWNITLSPGEYTLKEEVTPAGYFKALDQTFIVTSGINSTVTMYDSYTKASLYKLGQQANGDYTALSGAKLKLVNNEDPSISYTWTSEDEAHVINAIPAGTYTWTELSAPVGYKIAQEKQITIEYSQKNQEFVLNNDLDVQKTGTAIISKIDTVSGQPLEGAELQILDKDNQVVAEWTSTNEDKIVDNLVPGEYVVNEKVAPDGYFKSGKIKFEIIENQETPVKVVVENDYTKVAIVKRDKDTNELISGASMCLKNEAGDIVHEWVSAKEPEKIYGLQTGAYTIEELKAPDGYKIGKPKEIIVKEIGEVQEFSYENKKINNVPGEQNSETIKTSDDFNLGLYGMLILVSMIGLSAMVLKKEN